MITAAGGNALGNNRRAGVLADMNHLGAGICLLATIGDRDRIELADALLPAQHAGGILPGDRRTGFDLRPADAGAVTATIAALGHEVVDAALAIFVTRVPVLHRGVLDVGIFQRHQLDHCRMQLVFITLWGGTALEIGDLRPLVANDERTLELAGIGGVDPEVGRKLHRTFHAFRHVDEGAVGKHRGVQRREVVVRLGYDRTQILADQLRVFTNRFGDGAEDDARFMELLLEGGRHRDRVEHRIHGDTRQRGALVQRNTQLFIGLQQLGVDLIQALRTVFRLFRRTEIGDCLIVDGGIFQMRPGRRRHLEPLMIGFETPLEHPLWFFFLLGNEGDRAFIQARRHGIAFDVGHESLLVFATDQLLHLFASHGLLSSPPRVL